MTVLVNAIRQRIDIEIIDPDVIIQQLGRWTYQGITFVLAVGFKLICQMILTVIGTAWFVLWATGAILSNIH